MKRLTIIGAGPGGYETAVEAAKRGLEVTIISDGPVGGTCLNEGCIPTKALRHRSLSSNIEGLAVDYKNSVVDQLKKGVEFLLGGKNIRFVNGHAAFKDSKTVVVNGEEIESDYVIIATGSHSAMLPINGADLEDVLTSKEILDLKELPTKLCIIGAGVIGLEFASIFNEFGSQVSVLEFCPDILPRFDTDLAKRLKQTLSKKNISIETSASVQSITKVDGRLKIDYIKKDKEFSIEVDKVLMAVGRRPNVDTINLDDIGIEYSPKGIVVDSNMRTNVPNVYAIGDVTGGLMLAHVATFHGKRALDDILTDAGLIEEREFDDVDFSIVPAAIFTIPEAACVGLTEDECKQKGIAVKCLKSFFRANGKAISMNEPEGYCKIIVSQEDGKILGCHMFGAHSSDIIHEVAALMNMKATLKDFRRIIHAHPTLSEILQSAVHSA